MTARRSTFFFLVLATTGLGTLMMAALVRSGGVHALELAVLALFVPTFGWIALAFWTGVAGFFLKLFRLDPLTLRRLGSASTHRRGGSAEDREPPGPGSPRTAVVMAVFDEDPERVIRGLRAVMASVDRTGHGGGFDFFLLSDTRNPDLAAREGAAIRALGGVPGPVPVADAADVADRRNGAGGTDGGPRRAAAPPPAEVLVVSRRVPGGPDASEGSYRLVYRRRSDNPGRKAGNIADFCHRWGSGYEYMVVLDADSLVSGETLAELVELMDADPELGLVQTVPLPARQESLFGRLLQLGASLQAPMLAAGQSFWQGDGANYWGHNAIVRLLPFMEHCRLPVLPGRPPLGGEILSHDFVEASLLRRAGWKVHLRPHLPGSWEEVPAHVPGYAARDRRWAQGSLQHLRLLPTSGLRSSSRLHFLFGAMGYVSSLLWLLMLLASTCYVLLPDARAWAFWDVERLGVAGPAAGGGGMSISLLLVTAVVLLLPKVLATVLALLREAGAYGGGGRLLVSSFLEILFTVVVAPVMMMFQSRSVLGVLAGRDAGWSGGGDRRGRVSWMSAWRSSGWITVIGVVWAGITAYHSTLFFAWLSPIFLGLVLAVPIVRWTSLPAVGMRAREWGLFLVPTETDPHYVVRAAEVRTPPLSPANAPMEHAERALFELRRGRLLLVTPAEVGGSVSDGAGADAAVPVAGGARGRQSGRAPGGAGDVPPGSVLLAAVEGLRIDTLERLKRAAATGPRLVLTHHRATAIGMSRLPPDPTPTGWTVLLGRNGDTPGPSEILRLSSAARADFPRDEDPRPATPTEEGGLELVRAGRMLPAVVSAHLEGPLDSVLAADVEAGRILRVSLERIRDLTRAPMEVRAVSDAPVPLEGTGEARFVLFREVHGLRQHLAILVGEPEEWPEPLPVRIHSACLTGDLFGSLRCDCGEQLRGSLRYFAERGGGVLLYLEQEGRGIGLGNKLRAYSLQQEGLDTVDANCALGFQADERSYEAAVAMLRHLGIERIELLTNNPAKMRALESQGIRVVDRRALHGTLNRHNLPYVSAKVRRAGHWLEEMLASGLPEEPPSLTDDAPVDR